MRKLTFQTFWIACFFILIKTVVFAQAPAWAVNPASFANNMNLTAQVYLDGIEENGNNNVLAAFVGNELRGQASPVMVGGKAYYFLTVYSNAVLGETLNFKVYLSVPNSVHPALEEIDFLKNSQAGGYPNGFAVNISLGNDFPIDLLPIPPANTLSGYPFEGVELENYLSSQDNDPVAWSVTNGVNLIGSLGAGDMLTVSPVNPTWTGTDSLLVTATETGTSNAFSASKYARFTVGPDYGAPVFGQIPSQFVQADVPIPSGNLNDFLDFDGPCVEFSVEFMLPEGTEAMPSWSQPNSNSGSMSLVVQANFGENPIPGTSNKLAAFVDGELAGVASPQTVLGKELYFLSLANVAKGEIVLKLYDAGHQFIHQKAIGSNFVPAGSLGNFNDPFVVDFAPFLINLLPNGNWTTTILDPFWIGEQRVLFIARDCDHGDKVGSVELSFINHLCPSQILALPAGHGLCLESESSVSQVIWFKDGGEVGSGEFFGAKTPGVYHYEGLTPQGCPDIKSCPVVIEEGSGLVLPSGGLKANVEKSFPPCGETVLTSISLRETPPTAICKSATIYLGANGTASLTTNDVDGGSFSNCGTAGIFLSKLNFNCANFGINTIVLTIEDDAGRTATCSATVTVQDNIAPSVTCKNRTFSLNGSGSATILPVHVYQSGSDNCGTVNLVSVSPSSFNCGNLGPNTVTLTVNDGHGNSNSCTATVTLKDTTKPSVVCKNHTVALNANGSATITAANVFLSGTDNCGVVNLVSVSPSSFNCGNLGPNTVTLTVNDSHGNSKTCTATVSVQDNILPNVTCKNHTASLGANGSVTIAPANVYQSGNDNCGVVNFVSVSPSSFNCNQLGPNTVTLTVNDGHGNTKTCTATVTVQDNTAPVPNCPANIPDVVLDNNGTGTLPANIGDGSSTDNCTATETSPALSFTCAGLGTQTVTLTATDGTNTASKACTFNVVDNAAPSAACTAATVVAALGADGSYTIDPNSLDGGSSDACGPLSFSANPAVLTCQNEGTNTVTLTVTDGSGNPSSCTATVEVAPFITNVSIAHTNESCSGAGDGSISISATAPGGQLKYSVDGGANFTANGSFTNLSPGSYNIVIKVFGIPNICEVTGSATVTTGGTSQTWYKDSDNDGYSDGVTMTSCAQPPGFKLYADLAGPETDCNDNDPTAYPGQTWYKDSDDDDYTDGTTQVACSRPSGYKKAAELVNTTDIDCNDSNAAVNPGATEICNGIDDDCDGQVDEGVSGGLTWTGNVTFVTQADVDAWSSCYSVIDGSLTIVGYDITDLSNLTGIEEVTGTVSIYYNSVLASLDGLENLATVGGSLTIFYNFLLSDCCAIHDLINGGVTGAISIFFNAVGCNSVGEINAECGPAPLIQDPANTGISAFGELDFVIYPNPVSGLFTVRVPEQAGSGQVSIVNIHGRKVMAQEIEEGQTTYHFEGSTLPAGIYMAVLKTEGREVRVKRLVVE